MLKDLLRMLSDIFQILIYILYFSGSHYACVMLQYEPHRHDNFIAWTIYTIFSMCIRNVLLERIELLNYAQCIMFSYPKCSKYYRVLIWYNPICLHYAGIIYVPTYYVIIILYQHLYHIILNKTTVVILNHG